MEKTSKTETLFNSWNRPTVGIHQGLCLRHERHREIDRLWYVEVSLVECFWKVFGRKKQMWSFCVFVLFLFWGKILDGVFYSFFVGKGGDRN